MIHKKYNLENNKQVDVFDEVFPFEWRSYAFMFCQKSAFRLGWEDTSVPERQSHSKLLHSRYTVQDLINLKIFDHCQHNEILNLVKELNLKKCILNLSVPSDVNYVHAHLEEKKVLLYYVNLEWKEGWHGETLFYSENLKDIQLALPYTPGRLVIFDADIPHTIRPHSTIAAHHRLTLSIFYDKSPIVETKINNLGS